MTKSPVAVLTLAVLLGPALFAIDREPLEMYHQRRADILKDRDGIVVLFAGVDLGAAEALTPFRQEDYFYYLTGWNEPGAVLVLVPPVDGSKFPREILFLPARNAREEAWTGPKIGPPDEGLPGKTGVDAVLPVTQLDTELHRFLTAYNIIYTLTTNAGQEFSEDARHAGQLKTVAPFVQLRDVRASVDKLRIIKSAKERELIGKAVTCSMDAHREAMKAMKPGVMEYEIAALMNYVQHREGCIRPAYAPIVGSGFNSTVLHYDNNDKRIEAGDIVVMDVAGEYAGYASDITRTLPANGKFTARQREIYDIVLGAQKAAIAAMKPGMDIRGRGDGSVFKVAYDYINTHGKDAHGDALGKYLIHGVSHHVGLNVHDPGPTILAPGMIVTIEPGVYLPDEKLGVRIEDMVLITETGCQLLTASLVREAADVEKAMSQR